MVLEQRCRLDKESTRTHHQDAIELLTSDHRTVEQLFADDERGLQGPQAKREVVDRITRELSIHAAIEEASFYPEVKKALGEGGELVDEGLHEHQQVKEILAALEDLDPTEAGYDQQVASLIAEVRHHVQEEEGEMFPRLRAALSAEQLADIGEQLLDGKVKAPTRPHPAAPASGPGAKVAGPAAGMVDRARDKLGDRPADADAQRRGVATSSAFVA